MEVLENNFQKFYSKLDAYFLYSLVNIGVYLRHNTTFKDVGVDGW